MNNRESVLNTDKFDRRRFVQILDMSNRLQKLEQKGKEVFPTFSPLMSDIWAALYKMKPSLLEEGEFDEKYQSNHYIMDRVMKEEGFIQARSITRLDDLSSALGAVRYSEKVYEWIDERRKENEEFQKALDEAKIAKQSIKRAQQNQQEAQEEKQNAEQNGDKEGKTKAKRKQTNATKAQKKAENDLNQAMQQIQEHIQKAIEQNGGKLRQALQKATNETSQAKDELINMLAAGSGAGNGEGELQKLPLRDQIKLAELLSNNKKLRDIAEWAGRFKAIARKKQKSKHVETIDRSGVTFGIDVERLLPFELAFYKNPVTKLDFLRRYAEHQTMMYAPEGREQLGKGPIILCLDQSGSMHSLDEQSKGFALALMMIAKKQRRDFAIVLFSSSSKQKEFFYEKGKVKPSDLVDLAKIFLGGGTNFFSPLKKAVRIIEERKRYNKADIVFVTDGDPDDRGAIERYCAEEGEFSKKKKGRNFNVVTVLIGNEVSEHYVKKFSDKIVRASDFNNDNVADAVFTI